MNVSAENNLKVSVIVPVYNAEKYLEACLESIVTQSFPYLEIICINDGSDDKSAEILEEYVQKDSRVIVVNQEHKGMSAARNTGLEHASGLYVTFVNSSDFIEVNMIEVMLKNMITRNPDVVIESVWAYDDRMKSRVLKEDPYFTLSWMKPEFVSDVFSCGDILDKFFMLPAMVWAKMYRKSFLQENNIAFKEDLSYGDILFFYELLMKNPKLSIDKRQLYNYRINTSLIAEDYNEEHYSDMLKIMTILNLMFEKQPFYEQIKSDFLSYRLMNVIKSFLRVPKKFEKAYYRQIQNEFLNIDMLYYNEALLSKKSFYPLYCEIRNESYIKYKFKNFLKKHKILK